MSSARPTEDSLEGRKALIVGAYGGMGSAVAASLASEGVSCALMGRNRDRLNETAKICAAEGASAIVAVCDLSQTKAIETGVCEAIDGLGGLNFVINCAGSYQLSRSDDGDLATWDRVLDINLRGTYHVVRHALPEINRSPGGAVIKIGSIPSSYSGAGAFLTTTRGIDGYADALFEDVREYGTKVCTIRPGFVNTPNGGFQSPGPDTNDSARRYRANNPLRPENAGQHLPNRNYVEAATLSLPEQLARK